MEMSSQSANISNDFESTESKQLMIILFGKQKAMQEYSLRLDEANALLENWEMQDCSFLQQLREMVLKETQEKVLVD